MKTVMPAQRKASKYYAFAIGAALLLAGGVGGWYMHIPVKAAGVNLLRADPSGYKFIDPVLLLQVPEDTGTPQFQSLKKSISEYIATAKSKKMATSVSVYFRQLNKDKWIGVNQDELYAPASLSKVISMVAFLRSAQNNPAINSIRVTIAPGSINADSNQGNYPPANQIQIGQKYTTQELLQHMIIDSDNNAAFSIDSLTGRSMLDKTYADLTIPDPENNITIDFLSPKMYSRVFRSLYNGGYLSDNASEQALELLSKTTFTQGLVSGVPAGTTVSHKFGERTISLSDFDVPGGTTQTVKELHDCGIVYAQNDPYFICVMTKGTDFTMQQKVISDISGMAWKSMQQLDVRK